MANAANAADTADAAAVQAAGDRTAAAAWAAAPAGLDAAARDRVPEVPRPAPAQAEADRKELSYVAARLGPPDGSAAPS